MKRISHRNLPRVDPMAYTKLTLRMPVMLFNEIEKISREKNVSLSEYVRQCVVKELLENRTEQ